MVYTIDYNLVMRILGILFYIVYQWWINLILLMADTIVSYAISTWFFEKKKETVTVSNLLITDSNQ